MGQLTQAVLVMAISENLTDNKPMVTRPFDVCVIGGGINGAGIAFEAASRGLNVGLFEQHDFGFGASSATSKLAHGGLRYLEQRQFKLVRESLNERNFLLKSAPHLVKPLQFYVPLYNHSKWKPLQLKLGLSVYDWMQSNRVMPKHRMLSTHQIRADVPWLTTEGLVGCGSYFDAQMDDHRLIIELLLMAKDCGAHIQNYCKVSGIEPTASGVQIGLEPTVGNPTSVSTKSAVLAAGAWSNSLAKTPLVKPTKGVHIVLPDMDLNAALLLLSPKDDRVMFMMPWQGKTLVGTTDQLDDQAYDTPQMHAPEAQYLLDCVNAYHNHRVWCLDDVMAFFCGYRPLIYTDETVCSNQTREDAVVWLDKDVLSVSGGKYTTFRKMSQRAFAQLHQRCFETYPLSSASHDYTFIGALTPNDWPSDSQLSEYLKQYHVERDTLMHLISTYGALYKRILSTIGRHKETAIRVDLEVPMIVAELKYAIENEWVTCIEDFLFRRTYYGYLFHKEPDVLAAFSMAFNQLFDCKPNNSALPALKQLRNNNA